MKIPYLCYSINKLQCVYNVVAKHIHERSKLKWHKCKLRNSTMKAILANQSMINELSDMLKNRSRHGASLLKQNSPFILCWLQFLMTALPKLVMTHYAAKTDKTAYIIMMMRIKCLLIIHTILLDQPFTRRSSAKVTVGSSRLSHMILSCCDL